MSHQLLVLLYCHFHAHQHYCLFPALSSFKGRMMQSSQRGGGAEKEGRKTRHEVGMKEREDDSLRHVALWCFHGRARAFISGEDVVPRLTSKSDSCTLVRGPRAGASYKDAGPISAFTPSFSPSLSTCSVQGAILHQRWVCTWNPGGALSSLGPPRLSQIRQQVTGA